MTIIKKRDWIFRDLYEDIISSAPEYRFKQDGIFLSKEDAKNIWKALTERERDGVNRSQPRISLASAARVRQIQVAETQELLEQAVSG